MARLTRQILDEHVDRVFGQAEEHLVTQGFAAPVFMGLDAYGRSSLLVTRTGVKDQPKVDVGPAGQPIYALPCGKLQEQAGVIAELVAGTRTVAAINVTEGWWLADADAVREVMETGMSASEHPDRQEILVVSGHWPREFYTTARSALVYRDDDGKPHPHRFTRRAVDASPDLAPGEELTSWLDHVLPGPPGRR